MKPGKPDWGEGVLIVAAVATTAAFMAAQGWQIWVTLFGR